MGFGTPAQLLCERKATANCLRYGARMTKLPHLILLFFVACSAIPALAESDLRLVVQITVDQLRGDTMSRFHDNLSRKGFRYLIDNGIHYTDAHYPYADTETAPGHASLATGANPSAHGIVSNDWIDALTGDFVYNTEDDRHSYIGVDKKPHQGVSPRNLLASTFGDELVVHNAGRSRVFSVSSKDRGAILPGGHAGKAFWYSNRTGSFVTSTFYYDAYPAWVRKWNAGRPFERFKGGKWELLYEQSRYMARDLDDRPYEADFAGLGRTFPHPLGDGSSKFFPIVLYVTPMADQLTLDFAKSLFDAEAVGQGDAVDYFAVSFSAPDVAGHLYGQSSLEYEDAVLRTDKNIEALLAHIDGRVGLENTLVVLSADHGGAEAPEYMQSKGMPAGRYPLDWIRNQDTLKKPLREKYARDDLLVGHSHPYVYLNNVAIAEAGLDLAEVEQFVADTLVSQPGIVFAMTRSQILSGATPDVPIAEQIVSNFHPKRSGNVHYIQQQYWFVHSTEEAEQLGVPSLAAIHGSPWSYDTHVPVLFAGPGVPRARVSRRISPLDIAPTLANYVGTKLPSGASGVVLHEVVTD